MATLFRRNLEIFSLLLCIGLSGAGCEDDPILTPGSAEEKNGGSYGRIDKLGVDTTTGATTSTIMTDQEENPELF